jgi:phospholipid transport system substrate-binding protein
MWEALRTRTREAWRAVSTGLGAPPARPGDVVRSAITRVRTVLNTARSLSNPLSSATPRMHPTELRKITNQVFDVEHMARGALWHHWARRPVAERRQFVGLFSDLLERLYIAHLRQSQWVTTIPVGEIVEGTFATVTWKIGTFQTAAVLDYRLHRRQGGWKIYDILLNGHSFVASCRADFDQAIRSASYATLVRELPRRDWAGFLGTGHTLVVAAASEMEASEMAVSG